MAFTEPTVATVHMISVHSLPDGLEVYIPSVLPGRFWIPPVDADPETFDQCVVNCREPGMVKPIPVRYASLPKSKSGIPYILLTIPDAKTIRHGTEEQSVDEWGVPLRPKVERAYLHVRAQELANEIEDQKKAFGVLTIKGEEPTDDELHEAFNAYRMWVMNRLRETASGWQRLGPHEVTRQALYLASMAYRRGWIPALPEWATLDTEAPLEDLFSCEVCNKQLRRGTVRCPQCNAIYDWEKALNFGIVSRADVPPAIAAKLAQAEAAAAHGSGTKTTR
jgi:hypothetical protein